MKFSLLLLLPMSTRLPLCFCNDGRPLCTLCCLVPEQVISHQPLNPQLFLFSHVRSSRPIQCSGLPTQSGFGRARGTSSTHLPITKPTDRSTDTGGALQRQTRENEDLLFFPFDPFLVTANTAGKGKAKESILVLDSRSRQKGVQLHGAQKSNARLMKTNKESVAMFQFS